MSAADIGNTTTEQSTKGGREKRDTERIIFIYLI
jgi:hypothetical protein